MKVSYTVGVEDMVALHRQAAMDSPSIQRRRKFNLCGGALFLFGLGVLQSALYHRTFEIFLGGVVGAAYYFGMKLFGERLVDRNVRRLYAEGTQQGIVGAHQLEIDGDSLKDTTSVGCQSVLLKSIDRVCETPTHYFIFLSAVSAHSVPKAGVVGDLPAFIAELRKAKGG